MFSKPFASELSCIDVLLTDQNSNPLEIEDKTITNLVINLSITYKMTRYLSQARDFCLLLKILVKIKL